MKIGSNGILVNQFSQVLLIRRDDTRTFAPPGGLMEKGELPTDNVVREVREETGLIVMPVRLTGLYFWPLKPTGVLNFTFRCLQRGGELQTSPESPQVGFFSTNQLPRNMLQVHRQRLEHALTHVGGAPHWQTAKTGLFTEIGRWLVFNLIYPFKDWRRARRGESPYVAPPDWRVGAFVVVRDESGQVLWIRRRDRDVWNLPGGGGRVMEPPWETAVRETYEETGLHVRLTNLTGVYVYENESHMILTFTGEVTGGTLTPNPEAAEFGWFTPGAEPPNTVPQHIERVADAVSEHSHTLFRIQSKQSVSEFE